MLGILFIFSPRSQALSLSGLKLKNALDSGHTSTPNAFHSLLINPKPVPQIPKGLKYRALPRGKRSGLII
jgi:hypothetical protein